MIERCDGVAKLSFSLSRLLIIGCMALLLLGAIWYWRGLPIAANSSCRDWQDWQRFKKTFISEGGRVVDAATPRQQTVSEAQAYALFFALVANDKATFDKLLQWTENNLAQGDLTAHLPAWLWGKRDDGSWGVIDDNSASDADLWLAYTLGEAGRLWQQPRFSAMSALLANRILRSEVVEVEQLGSVLLPGAAGFSNGDGGWRLNPSYLPLFILKRLAGDYPDSPWQSILQSSERVILQSAPRGLVPDWLLYRAGEGFSADPVHQTIGGYDAIRVYLWAGMMSPQDPAQTRVLASLLGMSEHLAKHGVPPQQIDAASGASSGDGPSGFSAALLPYLAALQQQSLLAEQLQRLQARPVHANPDAYYDHVLALFGQGWHERFYSFTAEGELLPAWKGLCANSP